MLYYTIPGSIRDVVIRAELATSGPQAWYIQCYHTMPLRAPLPTYIRNVYTYVMAPSFMQQIPVCAHSRLSSLPSPELLALWNPAWMILPVFVCTFVSQ